MKNRSLAQIFAVASVATLALSACSSDKASETTEAAPSSAPPSAAATVSTDCTPATATAGATPKTAALKVGTLLPETGSLAFLGPPMIAGVGIALDEVNAAGGVLDQPVALVTGDSGDTSTDTATATVDRELAEGADVIVGAASSAVSLKVLDKIASAGVVMFSPANTSDKFVCYADKGMYFRTAPTDVLQAQALSQLITGDGAQRVAIMALNDPYGTGLAANTVKDLEAAGIASDQIKKHRLRPERAVVQRRSRSGQGIQPRRHRGDRLRGVFQDHHPDARGRDRSVRRQAGLRHRREHGQRAG